MPEITHIGLALCECGHPASDHVEGYICTHKLEDENDGWYGVCPCVRYDDDLNPVPMPESVASEGSQTPRGGA